MFQCMQNKENPRALSHDERYAAEAAFAGRPLNPRWSARAKAVYEGIRNPPNSGNIRFNRRFSTLRRAVGIDARSDRASSRISAAI